ncbi:hypothetical protein [Variovorax rhizosphaerae]|uniref:Permease n=1 Tax=Variovorax rhizosphaerae TaxID=1836200 RepID=A0ABU8WHB0_9BURK
MEFLKFIRSLEELLYEVMTWLLFYPRTLWRVVRHPLTVAAKAEAEMDEPPEKQFVDLVSPPLFLMLTILLAHALEIALHQNSVTTRSDLSRALMASETNLLIFRAIAWSFFPLLMAWALLVKQGRVVDRETLRRPFFLQCLFASPFTAGIAIATALGRLDFAIASGVVALTTIAWYFSVQTRWFHMRLGLSRGRAFLLALWVFLLALTIDLAVAAAIFA